MIHSVLAAAGWARVSLNSRTLLWAMRESWPTLESILGQGQGQDPSCSAQVRSVTIPRCHPLTVCHSTRKYFLRGNQKFKPFHVILNHCIYCLTIVTRLPRFLLLKYLSKHILISFYLVSVQNGWRFMVESHRLYAGSGPGPSLSPC